jgi:site-specific DNA-cytosine methylase
MKILVACEESQAVTIELRKLGNEAYSCDLMPCSGGYPEWHIQNDVFEVINKGWDMMIAFPPCTYLTVTGARWLYNKDGSKNIARWQAQDEAIEFVKKLYYLDIKYVAIENPVGKLSSAWMKPTQIIQPYYFGDAAQKTTCLWLKNLPPLIHNKEPNLFDEKVTHVDRGKQREYINNKGKRRYMSEWYWETSKGKGKERQIIRSKTFPGIAKAMAKQWTEYVQKMSNLE